MNSVILGVGQLPGEAAKRTGPKLARVLKRLANN